MTVLHCDTGRGWRGGQRQVLLLARGLAARGVRTAVAAPDGSPLAERARAAGLEVHDFAARGDLDIMAAGRLARLVRTVGADVVHAHDARSHAMLLLGSLGGGGYGRIVTRRTAFAPRRDPLTRLKYGRRIDGFVAISRAVAEGLAAVGVGRERIHVVPSGVEAPGAVSPVDWRARLGLGPEARVVGSLGALSREKGYDVLVAALARLRTEVHLVLVGSGEERDALGALASALGFGGRVHLPGRTDRPYDALAGFDAYVQPSRAEGLGTSVIDAMALGVPVVASRVGGLAEVVVHETTGLLVAVDDAAALGAAVARLLADPALATRVAEAGRRRAEDFSADAMVEGTLAVYRALGRAG